MKRFNSLMVFALVVCIALVGCKDYEGPEGDGGPMGPDNIVVNPQTGSLRLVPSQDSVGYNQTVDLDVKNANGDSILSTVDEIYLLQPQHGEITLTRGDQGEINAASLRARVGKQIVVIARKGNQYSFASVYGTANAWLEVEVPRYDLMINESRQIRVNYVQGNSSTDYTSLINFRTYKPDGTLYADNADNPIATLSSGGILTGKANGFVHVLMQRTISGNLYTVEAWFMVGTPSIDSIAPTAPFLFFQKGEEAHLPVVIKPASSLGYPSQMKIYAVGLYREVMSTQPSIAVPIGDSPKIQIFDDNLPEGQEVKITAKLDNKSVSWVLFIYAPYDAAQARTGYGLFRWQNLVFVMADHKLLAAFIGVSWDEKVYAHASGAQFHSGVMARGRGYAYWALPWTPEVGSLIRYGFSVPIDPNEPETREYTPDGSSTDKAHYGTDWENNGQGGGNIVGQVPESP